MVLFLIISKECKITIIKKSGLTMSYSSQFNLFYIHSLAISLLPRHDPSCLIHQPYRRKIYCNSICLTCQLT